MSQSMKGAISGSTRLEVRAPDSVPVIAEVGGQGIAVVWTPNVGQYYDRAAISVEMVRRWNAAIDAPSVAADMERRKRVVETARRFLSSASCSGELTVDNCAEASRLALICAEAFETAAEKYVKGEK